MYVWSYASDNIAHYIPPSLPSLRAQFCEDESAHNPLHGSDTPSEAEKEIRFFFPKEKTLAVIKPNAMEERGKTTLREADTVLY